MSNLEQRIQAKTIQLEEEAKKREREEQARLAKEREAEQKAALDKARARALGEEVVALLQKHDIPSRPMWVRRQNCKFEEHTTNTMSRAQSRHYSQDAKYYQSLGRAWEICDVRCDGRNKHLGITDKGKVINGVETYGPDPETYSHEDDSSRALGVINPKFSDTDGALWTLEKDDDFLTGLTMLVNGDGIHKGKSRYS